MYNAIWVSYFQIIDFKSTLRGLGIRSTWESCMHLGTIHQKQYQV